MKLLWGFITILLVLLYTLAWAEIVITAEDIPLEQGVREEWSVVNEGEINDTYTSILMVGGPKEVDGVSAFVIQEEITGDNSFWYEWHEFKNEGEYTRILRESFLEEVKNEFLAEISGAELNIYGSNHMKILELPLSLGKSWDANLFTLEGSLEIEGYRFILEGSVGEKCQVIAEENIDFNGKTYIALKVKRETKYTIRIYKLCRARHN